MRALLAKPFLVPVGLFCMSMTASAVFYSASGPALAPTTGATLLRANINRMLSESQPGELFALGSAPTTYDTPHPNLKTNTVSGLRRNDSEILYSNIMPNIVAIEQAYDKYSSPMTKTENEALFDSASLNDIPPFAFGSLTAESADGFEVAGGGGESVSDGGGGAGHGDTIVTSAVPETSTWLMMLFGFSSLAAYMKLRARKSLLSF